MTLHIENPYSMTFIDSASPFIKFIDGGLFVTDRGLTDSYMWPGPKTAALILTFDISQLFPFLVS